jgi:hypothetical protein
VPLLIECKDQDGGLGPDVGRLERAAAAELAGYSGHVALMSFNPHSVLAFAELCPDLPRGLTTERFPLEDWPTVPATTRERLRGIPDYDRTGACFISHDWHSLSDPRVAELKSEGAGILCWTILSPAQEAEARKVAGNVTFEGYLP